MAHEAFSRRAFVAVSAATGASISLTEKVSAAADGKKIFTILNTNDMHSNLLGVGHVSEYTPASLKDGLTIGGVWPSA